jgi:hypothetical protein
MAITKATASSVAPAAAGDLVYGSGTNDAAVLGIGTAGQVLAVNTGETAPEWVTPAGGTNYTLLNAGGTSTSGVASVTISGLGSYDKILLFLKVMESPSIAGETDFGIRLNGDTGSNYNFAGFQAEPGSAYAASVVTAIGTDNTSSITFARKGSTVNSQVSGTFKLEGGNSTGQKVFTVLAGGTANNNNHRSFATQGFWDNAATLSSITFLRVGGSGDMGTGTIFVYGSA